jgi:hypothetical protein
LIECARVYFFTTQAVISLFRSGWDQTELRLLSDVAM